MLPPFVSLRCLPGFRESLQSSSTSDFHNAAAPARSDKFLAVAATRRAPARPLRVAPSACLGPLPRSELPQSQVADRRVRAKIRAAVAAGGSRRNKDSARYAIETWKICPMAHKPFVFQTAAGKCPASSLRRDAHRRASVYIDAGSALPSASSGARTQNGRRAALHGTSLPHQFARTTRKMSKESSSSCAFIGFNVPQVANRRKKVVPRHFWRSVERVIPEQIRPPLNWAAPSPVGVAARARHGTQS